MRSWLRLFGSGFHSAWAMGDQTRLVLRTVAPKPGSPRLSICS
jgi:hypothetical protein